MVSSRTDGDMAGALRLKLGTERGNWALRRRTAPVTAITARAAGWSSRLRRAFSMPEGVS